MTEDAVEQGTRRQPTTTTKPSQLVRRSARRKEKIPTSGGSTLHLLVLSSTTEDTTVVDLATRKPMMLQVDNEILFYQFTSGAAEVSLPPEVQQAFNSWRKQIHQASLVPPG